jgi:hypothetical protein
MDAAVCRKHGTRGELVPCFVQIARSELGGIMSSNESIFTTEPFPTRTERKIAKNQRRIIRRAVLAVIAAVAGITVGTIGAGMTEAGAVSQATINRYIRDNGGIPPCKEEDGSGQPGMCFWDDGSGDAIVLVPTKPGQDKRVVVLINR